MKNENDGAPDRATTRVAPTLCVPSSRNLSLRERRQAFVANSLLAEPSFSRGDGRVAALLAMTKLVRMRYQGYRI